MSRGRIRKALGGFYYVDAGGETLACRARGKFRMEGRSPLVGDWAEVRETGPGQSMVWEIEPRRNVFDRPAVANIDQLVVVAAAAVPVTDPFLIDRIAAVAALKNCGLVVCVNKCDLVPGDGLADVYRRAGLRAVCASAETGRGLEDLRGLLQGKLSAFTGNSGVGKSSLLNALQPGFNLRAGEVSQRLGRGRHTTRHVELYRLDCGAEIIDTPGFGSFDARELELELKDRLPECFVEFRPYLGQCRFAGCSHTKERGCAVLRAVRDGTVPSSRHQSYARLYDELKGLRPWTARK